MSILTLVPSEVGVAIAAGVVWAINEVRKHRDTKKDVHQKKNMLDNILDQQAQLRKDFENEMEKVKSDIKALRSEFKPNGGSSGRDLWDEMKGLQQAQFHAQLNQVKTPIYLCDKKGNCTFANSALSTLFGLHYKDMLGRGWLKAIGRNQTEREEVWNSWIASVERDIPFVREYEVINQRTGKDNICITQAEAQRRKDGDVMFFLGTVTPK